MSQQNRISVVSICFNNLEELKKTMNSIDEQRLLPYEHLIIDGSTKDEIRGYLSLHAQPHYRRWISERDQGISDAFNKGVRNAEGDIIHLLNSGDTYASPQVLDVVHQAFERNPGISWLHGMYYQMRSGSWVKSGKAFDRKLLFRGMRQTGHPTMFIRRGVYERHGLYSESKKIAMDYDLLIRIADEPYLFLEEPIARFEPDGVSSQQIGKGLAEVRESFERKFGTSIKQRVWFARIHLLNSLQKSAFGRSLIKMIKGGN